MQPQPRWQDVPTEKLERIYNPRAANAHVETRRAQLVAQSKQAREQLADTSVVTEDLRYGPNTKQVLDLYQPRNTTNPATPLVVYIHGGYWRGGDKHESALVVPALLGAGAVVANVNYDLCPDITLDEMVKEIIGAVRFCHQQATSWHANPNHLVLIGHSAGAHLAARVMNEPADNAGLPAALVHSVVALTGIYEPEVITKISVNDEAQIDPSVARRNDCLSKPPQGNARFFVSAGGDEPAGWIDQTHRYAQWIRSSGFECHHADVPGTDHFTLISESFNPESEAFSRIERMLT
jgi:arylformamidase